MYIFKNHQIFSILQQYLVHPKIIVEVGAFHGHDTIKMTNHWPKANIHSFEPVPELYQTLRTKTKPYSNIHTYNYAIDTHSGSSLFYYAEKPNNPGIATQAGSLLEPKERLLWSPIQFTKTITVQTITLAQWMTQNNITNIDFLWLDTQGHELPLLKHAKHLLSNIQVIVTEVGFIEGYKGQETYPAIVKWITEHGFDVVARDFENTTDWFFGNIICVKKRGFYHNP